MKPADSFRGADDTDRGSIREFSFTNPILINSNQGIIVGHGLACGEKEPGLETVLCIDLSHLTEEQKWVYTIADNRRYLLYSSEQSNSHVGAPVLTVRPRTPTCPIVRPGLGEYYRFILASETASLNAVLGHTFTYGKKSELRYLLNGV